MQMVLIIEQFSFTIKLEFHIFIFFLFGNKQYFIKFYLFVLTFFIFLLFLKILIFCPRTQRLAETE